MRVLFATVIKALPETVPCLKMDGNIEDDECFENRPVDVGEKVLWAQQFWTGPY